MYDKCRQADEIASRRFLVSKEFQISLQYIISHMVKYLTII